MAGISKAEYLKRYMSGTDQEEKKKKKKKSSKHLSKHARSKIIDDDIDVKALLPSNLENTIEEELGEDDPTIVAIVDERPDNIKQLESYRHSDGRWKMLGDDDKFDPALLKSMKEEDILKNKKSLFKGELGNDRPRSIRKRHDSDSGDELPKRIIRQDSESPPRKRSSNSNKIKHRHDSDSDQSLPKEIRYSNSDTRKSSHHRRRHDSDSDETPSRNKRQNSSPDISPTKRTRHRSGSDTSPPRRRNESDKLQKNLERLNSDESPPIRKRHYSDESPPRRKRLNSDESSPRRKRHDSDESPPRRKRHDSDESPPRRKRLDSDESPPRRKRLDSGSDQSPPRKKEKMDKTLSGKQAGLSSAKDMKAEAEKIRKKEKEAFKKIGDEALGRTATTVFRDKKTGRRRNLDEEAEEDAEKMKKERVMAEKYQKWGKGLKQQEQQQRNVEEHLYEMSKPLARSKDDQDLDKQMRDMERAEDPMLKFIKKKKSKEKKNTKELPKYKGPPPPPNRFGLQPGYRWDGVDRSTGFEAKYFSSISNKKATADAAYKWSVEDM